MSSNPRHNGMRPQDVLVLLKLISLDDPSFRLMDVAQSIGISLSELSDSIGRSVFAQLIAPNKKTPLKKAIFEFLVHGLPYVFPARPGALVVGIPTAHSAPPLSSDFGFVEPVVWASSEGELRGQEVPTFHPKQAQAAIADKQLHELLALTDALRIGKAREKKLAEEALRKRILTDERPS